MKRQHKYRERKLVVHNGPEAGVAKPASQKPAQDTHSSSHGVQEDDAGICFETRHPLFSQPDQWQLAKQTDF